ncbi:hypothetical protein GCM10020216_108320 [Nonomuraea helvata]
MQGSGHQAADAGGVEPIGSEQDAVRDRCPELADDRFHAVYAGPTRPLRDSLADDHPGRAAVVYDDAAYQVMALAYGHGSFMEIGLPATIGASAHRLASAVLAGVAASPPA